MKSADWGKLEHRISTEQTILWRYLVSCHWEQLAGPARREDAYGTAEVSKFKP